ncbi:MAG TPA: 2TM domain-containing protein [Saprospiraceae bacterium]|nr:2TM domain-containing protein [Saprospiraceae bacterium]
MDEKLRNKAEKKVDAKMAFYICAVVFFFISTFLVILSFYLGAGKFWLRLPILVFAMVLGILYLQAFGFPFSSYSTKDWREEEIQREMQKLRRPEEAWFPGEEELSEADILELKELRRLKEKWGGDEEFV